MSGATTEDLEQENTQLREQLAQADETIRQLTWEK